MGKKYGVTQQAWQKWENGKLTPKPLIMKQLEIDSGIPMEELFPDVFNNHRLLNIGNEQLLSFKSTGTEG
jgi:hypothetical protein